MGPVHAEGGHRAPQPLVAQHRDHPSIFFEESQFCNRRQITDSGKDGPASGFGQMETGNPDKQEYYARRAAG